MDRLGTERNHKKMPGTCNKLLLSDYQGFKQNEVWLINYLNQAEESGSSLSLIVPHVCKTKTLTRMT